MPRAKQPGSAIRWIRRAAVALVLGALFFFVARFAHLIYSRQAIAAIVLTDGSREMERLVAIAASLKAFHASEGRYPASETEWFAHDSNARSLMETSPLSPVRRRIIDFGAIGDPERIVTMAPPSVYHGFWHIQNQAEREMASGDLAFGPPMVLRGDLEYQYITLKDIEMQDKRREFSRRAGWSFDEHDPD